MPDPQPSLRARQSGQASEPRNHRARCRSCSYGGWTWLFGGKRYCRPCAQDHGYTDPVDDCKAGVKPCEACSTCRLSS